jgi:hypothetical protein
LSLLQNQDFYRKKEEIKTAKPIHGSLKLHAFLPIQKVSSIEKKLSTSAGSQECWVNVLQKT